MIRLFALICCFWLAAGLFASELEINSPDGNISVKVNYSSSLSYSVSFGKRPLISDSPLGFEFKGEPAMHTDFVLFENPIVSLQHSSWIPVVKNKHSQINLIWNEAKLALVEGTGEKRRMDVFFRVYNNGIAFRYQLYGSKTIGNRIITKELTGFSVPSVSQAWVAEYVPKYTSGQETEFKKCAVTLLTDETVAGLPFLVEVDKRNYLAITEAHIDNYPGFYIGSVDDSSEESTRLTTKLSPLPGEEEDGGKAYFSDKLVTPWRVIMVGDHPGKFIESEIIQGLNPPCAIDDPSWIQPGICSWDHWWSGEVKMEMPVIKEYIDFASEQGWPYMLIDWQWYGTFNQPDANITKPAPQLNMPEILEYAHSKNVRCWLWLYSSDVNRNNAFEEAFPLYQKWGIAGVKIDFMDRDDQDMVNWYRKIINKAAEHKLMVNFHGAYKPDGIERTYPNMITREGVLGEEYAKFSNRITPEHNITLAFTRMLAGPMDYTPGGFLNATKETFKQQSPTMIMNTRCAELAKFVIYESPLTVFCDHPKHVLGQPGAEFLRTVPTVWDDTRFIDGYLDEYIVMARRLSEKWYLGAMNNSLQRTISLQTDFLPDGKYKLEYWEDAKDANKYPTHLVKKEQIIISGKPLKIQMANGGGYVAILSPIN